MVYEHWKTAHLIHMYNAIRESLEYDQAHPPSTYGVRAYHDLLDQVQLIEQVLDVRGVDYVHVRWT